MAKITVYKNSKFATVLSFISYLTIAGGVYAVFEDEPVGGIIAIVIGIAIKVLAAVISKKKSQKDAEFDKWLAS